MNAENPLEILKKAILLERRGNAFYRQAAESAGDVAVKQFFESMAQEEVKHVDVLSAQYRNYMNEKRFDFQPSGLKETDIAAKVLTEDLKGKITAAGFEAAAISAAMAMEERAIKLYTERAAASSAPEEQALYQWLADWEKEHLRILAAVDRALTESIWSDNRFWPF